MTITENQIEETLAFWQPRSPKPLTEDDAEKIAFTLNEFMTLLRKWYSEACKAQRTEQLVG